MGLVTLLPLEIAQAKEKFVVVVHPSTDVTKLSKKELSKVFLGRTSKWNDGTPVKLIEQRRDNPVRGDFTARIHGKSIAAILAHWRQMLFSGRGVPPAEKTTDAEIIAYVKRKPGAIGYVSADADVRQVKVVEIH